MCRACWRRRLNRFCRRSVQPPAILRLLVSFPIAKFWPLVDLRMEEAQGRRLGRLLDRQQAGKLREEGRNELAALMQVYHECLVRKAQALSEAVRRGLREPLAR